VLSYLPTSYMSLPKKQARRIRNLLGMELTFTQDIISRRESVDQEIKDLIGLI
jgi:hypothetical protein